MSGVWVHEDGMPDGSRPSDRVQGTSGNPYWRMRLLERFWQYFHVFKGKIFTLIRQPAVRPRFHDNIDNLAKAIVTFLHRHLKSFELFGVEASACSPIQPPCGQNIEQRQFLGQPERMIKRRQRHSGSNAQTFGSRSSIGSHDGNRGAHAVIAKMVLSQPHRVISSLVHNLDAL